MSETSISVTDFDALIDSGEFSQQFLQKAHKRLPLHEVVTAWGPLDASHIAAANRAMENPVNLNTSTDIKVLRASHHRAAQLIAMGMEQNKVAALCNRSVQGLSHLMGNPAFRELVAHYIGVKDDEFADFTSAAAALSMDMLSALQEMLDNSPERFAPGHLMDAIKLLADRTGHAPVQKSFNVNVNSGMGERLRAARERAAQVFLESDARDTGT